MASATLECKSCGTVTFLQPARKGQSQLLSLAGSQGWTFTTVEGWRCGADACATVDVPVMEEEQP